MTLLLALVFWLCVFALVYTFGGYAVLMTVLARVRHRPVRAAPITPAISFLSLKLFEECIDTRWSCRVLL